MDKQLIKKEDVSIFTKIKLFIKNLFSKTSKQQVVDMYDVEEQQSTNTEFENRVKVQDSDRYNKEQELRAFTKRIEDNPEIIENLSDDRLHKLIAYYEKVTEEKREKIKKMRASLG